MKKLLFSGLVLSVTLPTKAQWYGQISYQHDSVIHSSANVAPLANSFVMGSYRRVRQFNSNTLDFAIDAVDQTTGTNPAWEYQISGTCVKPAGTHNCLGIGVVENSNPQNAPTEYAIVGETIDGIFFTTINAATGVRLKTCSWKKINPNVEDYKPVIKESNASPGFFYILANDGNVFHVMMINGATGNQQWGATYKTSSGIIEARDLAESKYNGSAPFQVVVVGTYYDSNSGRGIDGFWAGINPNSGVGNINFPTVYDLNSLDNSFSSVEGMMSLTSGGVQTYILGGSVNNKMRGTYQLVSRLTPSGSQIWNSLILPKATATYRDICRINERKNTNVGAPSPWEYYCVARADYNYDVVNNVSYLDDNLVVFKLDNNGNSAAFTAAGVPTEFHYSGLSALGMRNTYADVTVLETGGGTSDGIQVYGTNANTPPQNDIVKSYFNGVNGCNETQTDITGIHHYNLNQQAINVNFFPFNQCSLNNPTQFDISLIGNANNNSCIQTPPVAGGSNARSGNVTGSIKNEQNPEGFKLLPNLITSKTTLTIPASTDENGEITIYNSVGQLINTISFNAHESQKQIIDFNELKVKGGVYFINVKAGNTKARFTANYVPE
jgi:hypothetical protein